MARIEHQGPVCNRCEAPIAENQKVCACGRPTVHMTFEERARFEVEQWRAYQQRQSTA